MPSGFEVGTHLLVLLASVRRARNEHRQIRSECSKSPRPPPISRGCPTRATVCRVLVQNRTSTGGDLLRRLCCPACYAALFDGEGLQHRGSNLVGPVFEHDLCVAELICCRKTSRSADAHRPATSGRAGTAVVTNAEAGCVAHRRAPSSSCLTAGAGRHGSNWRGRSSSGSGPWYNQCRRHPAHANRSAVDYERSGQVASPRHDPQTWTARETRAGSRS